MIWLKRCNDDISVLNAQTKYVAIIIMFVLMVIANDHNQFILLFYLGRIMTRKCHSNIKKKKRLTHTPFDIRQKEEEKKKI